MNKFAQITAASLAIGAASIALAGTASAATGDTPGAPKICKADRGLVSSCGNSVVRTVDSLQVLGGTVSAGAPIVLSDGNAASLPKINTTYWATKGQAVISGFGN